METYKWRYRHVSYLQQEKFLFSWKQNRTTRKSPIYNSRNFYSVGNTGSTDTNVKSTTVEIFIQLETINSLNIAFISTTVEIFIQLETIILNPWWNQSTTVEIFIQLETVKEITLHGNLQQ